MGTAYRGCYHNHHRSRTEQRLCGRSEQPVTTKTESLEKMREKGAYDAQQLQTKAAAGTVTQTEIIDEEIAVPAFDPKKDYSAWPVNSPVSDEGQV